VAILDLIPPIIPMLNQSNTKVISTLKLVENDLYNCKTQSFNSMEWQPFWIWPFPPTHGRIELPSTSENVPGMYIQAVQKNSCFSHETHNIILIILI